MRHIRYKFYDKRSLQNMALLQTPLFLSSVYDHFKFMKNKLIS